VHETDFERAHAWLEESLDVYQKVGNQKSVVNCLYNLAWIAWVNGDDSSALQRINESIALSQNIEEKTLLATGLLLRSEIKLSLGYIAYSLEGLAKIALQKQLPDQAARLFGAASRLFQCLANTLSPMERKWREDDIACARRQLGTEAFQRMWEEGYALTTHEAV
jgi:hypothetical protein